MKLPNGDGYILAPVIGPDEENKSEIQWEEFWYAYSEEEIKQKKEELDKKGVVSKEFGYHDIRMKKFTKYYVRIPSLN